MEPAPLFVGDCNSNPDKGIETDCAVEIDVDTVLESVGGDRADAIELLRLFFKLAKADLVNMYKAGTPANMPRLTELAHKLVGSAATCGMVSLSANLSELERYGSNGIGDKIESRINRIEKQLVCAQVFYENHWECKLG